MASLSFRCRVDRVGDDGWAPIDLRISNDGTRRFITTDIRVNPDKWRDGSVTRSHRQAAEINAGLRRIESTAQEALTSLQTSGVQVSADRIKSAIEEALDPEPDESTGFALFCEDRIPLMYDKRSTRKNHLTAITKLREFLRDTRGVEDIPLSPRYLTPALLEEMQTWESEVRGNATNTIHKTMRTLRRMINVAIRDGLFPEADYPFDYITLSRERTEKTPLTAEQVRSLETLLGRIDDGEARFTTGGLPAHSLRVFLFSVYMLGMRWSDVSSLEWSQIRGQRVRYQMRKTGAQKDLKLVPPAEEILEFYAERQGSTRFVFPLLERYAHKHDLSEEAGLRRAIEDMNRRVNQELKEIADAAGIDLSLSTHVARHTSAQRMMQQGWNLQEIQAALGHESISTTEHYLRTVRDEELDDKHEELW